MVRTRVPFVDLRAQIDSLESEFNDAFARVLRRGDFILGEDVQQFESEFAAYLGVRHVVGVDSGLSAIELTLRAMNIGSGDEVITQANTFIATVAAIQSVGATPVLTDCDERGDIELDAVAAAITSRTRAVLPVHLFGRIGPIKTIQALAAQHGILIVEDACQAHGAVQEGRRAGSFGFAGAFSFYPAKNLGAFGDGGAVATSSPELADTVRTLRNYGQKAKYDHVALPLNRRLDTVQAAILRIKLRHLDEWNARRERLADVYRDCLAGLPVVLPEPEPAGRHVYHLFVIETRQREGLRAALRDAAIETGVHYPVPVHLQAAMSQMGYGPGSFPQAERLSAVSLSLPLYPELPVDHIEYVAAEIREFFNGR